VLISARGGFSWFGNAKMVAVRATRVFMLSDIGRKFERCVRTLSHSEAIWHWLCLQQFESPSD
jgi:hypothetical protein